MTTRRLNDLCPDGVRVVVAWDSMVVGASIFVPCINTKKAIRQIKSTTNKKDWKIESRVHAENGLLGVRVWRTC